MFDIVVIFAVVVLRKTNLKKVTSSSFFQTQVFIRRRELNVLNLLPFHTDLIFAWHINWI